MDSVGASMGGQQDDGNIENVEAFLDELAKTAAETEALEAAAGAPAVIVDAPAVHWEEQ